MIWPERSVNLKKIICSGTYFYHEKSMGRSHNKEIVSNCKHRRDHKRIFWRSWWWQLDVLERRWQYLMKKDVSMYIKIYTGRAMPFRYLTVFTWYNSYNRKHSTHYITSCIPCVTILSYEIYKLKLIRQDRYSFLRYNVLWWTYLLNNQCLAY